MGGEKPGPRTPLTMNEPHARARACDQKDEEVLDSRPAPTRTGTLVRRSPKSDPRPLTPRECATLERLARGMAQKMIAFEFGISINTVGNLACGFQSGFQCIHRGRFAKPNAQIPLANR